MSSSKTLPELIDMLIAILPDVFSQRGKRAALVEVRFALKKISVTLNNEGFLEGLPDNFWKKIFENLIKNKTGTKKSRESQRRYAIILNEIASIWKQKGWIQKLPEIKLSSQHPRRLTVRVDLMRGEQYSCYLKLLPIFVIPFTGKLPGKLVPEGLENDIEAYLALGLILNGVCRERAIAQLKELQWGDIPLHPDLPISMPHPGREQYYWFWPMHLVRLLLEAARQRRKGKNDGEPVFNSSDLAGDVRKLLTRLCKQAGIPVISIEQVVYSTRLHLRQIVPDPVLAVWLGLIPFRPRPMDQVSNIENLIDMGVELPRLTSQYPTTINNNRLLQGEMGSYHLILDELQDDLEAVFTNRRPKSAIERLQNWIESHKTDYSVISRNICLLLGWLLIQIENKSISPESRYVYWLALKRIWKKAPADRFESFKPALFEDFVTDEDYSLSSRRTSMRVWRSLIGFCRKNHIHVETKKLPHVMGKVDAGFVRVLSRKNIYDLFITLDRFEEKIAVYLAYRLCLRVSEVCNLLNGDFCLGKKSFVYVVDSKFGKSRRVDLSFLPIEEWDRLKEAVEYRTNQSGPGGHFLITRYGRKLEADKLSNKVKVALRSLGLCADHLLGQEVSFHSLRRQGINDIFHATHDLRAAALQAGHSLVLTTTGSYMSDLDLEGVESLKGCVHPLNDSQVCTPLLMLATLTGKTDRRLVQMVAEFNVQNPDKTIVLRGPKETPDGKRPGRPGKPAEFISVVDAIQLLK